MDKVKWWIADLQEAEKTGKLPQFMIMSLGEDHTKGTTPDAFKPDACVGSNDLGLGRLVAAASKSSEKMPSSVAMRSCTRCMPASCTSE